MKHFLRLQINPADMTLDQVQQLMDLLFEIDKAEEAEYLHAYLLQNEHILT